MTKFVSITLLALSILAMPLDAQAKSRNTAPHNGPIIISGPIDCEKETKLVCWDDATGHHCIEVEQCARV